MGWPVWHYSSSSKDTSITRPAVKLSDNETVPWVLGNMESLALPSYMYMYLFVLRIAPNGDQFGLLIAMQGN